MKMQVNMGKELSIFPKRTHVTLINSYTIPLPLTQFIFVVGAAWLILPALCIKFITLQVNPISFTVYSTFFYLAHDISYPPQISLLTTNVGITNNDYHNFTTKKMVISGTKRSIRWRA